MCHHITATLPERADLTALEALLKRHRQVLKPLHNPHIEAQLPQGSRYLSCTHKYCDCGTPLGSMAGSAAPSKADRAPKKGWSTARIERWRAEKEAAAVRIRRDEEAQAPRALAEEWVAYIQDLLASGATSSFGLLLHWYSHGVETERFPLTPMRTVRQDEIEADVLLHMKDDCLYLFVNR